MNSQLGKALRAYRKDKNLTLTNLAEITGLSSGYLSILERGLNSPTLENLNKICQALGITMVDLLEHIDANSASIVTKKDSRRIIYDDDGLLYEAATEGEHNMSCMVMTVNNTADHVSHGHIADEVGYVICGSIVITVDGVEHTLGPGDCIYIEADLPHSYRRISEEPCAVFWTYANSTHNLP